ncbi:polysaccharide deacetylase family protein [Cellulomonas sp. ES6]|uniref:polysaccharide deacetylase family protein n=1 Tax=Cellulomonas sp. ES6 TaxID=3039384 RepID=UPI0024B64F31|nr:polysaccharide deacetylase family protein [Cellulomonas sp. ES6]WHP18726.1 polysaccharide deacetylase family protein [Cellulomonas sp. ES6]
MPTPLVPREQSAPRLHPGRGRVVLRRDMGEFGDPAPRPLPRRAVVELARPVLQPLAALVGVETLDRVVALTFDDGPDPHHTPRLLDVLGERGAHATFFVLSEAAEQHPDLVRRIVAEGHELALHSRDHRRRLAQVPYEESMRVVAESRAVVEQIAGRPIHLFRPPYGSHTVRQRRGWARQGLRVVLWSSSVEDWYHGEQDEMVRRAYASLHPGALVLMHDTRADPETASDPSELPRHDRAAVLDALLRRIAADGYRTRTAGELLSEYPPVRAMMRDMMR